MKKPSYTATLMHYKARGISCDLSSSKQGNDSRMKFVAVAAKINLKNLKTSL